MELLAPAGDLNKLKTAIAYGADAVYFGSDAFSMRALRAFDEEEIRQGIEYAHKHGKKAYLTANIMAHNADLEGLYRYAKMCAVAGADAMIVGDPGVFSICREACSTMDLHISTQANVTNYRSALTWKYLGASRVILARELSFDEVEEIKRESDMEIEIFVHGAMCMAYSGRCMLSNYFAYRDANKGNCAQPCRWKYHLMESERPGEYMEIEEDSRGTFIFNSKDLCLIDHIADMARIGVDSLKIEGRVKSDYYLATVVKTYREEIDRYLAGYEADPSRFAELEKVSHRGYSKGFATGERGSQVYETSSYIRNYDVVAVVTAYDAKSGIATCEQRNKFYHGDTVEVLQPGEPFFAQVAEITDEEGGRIESTPHAQMVFYMKMKHPVVRGAFVRKKVE